MSTVLRQPGDGVVASGVCSVLCSSARVKGTGRRNLHTRATAGNDIHFPGKVWQGVGMKVMMSQDREIRGRQSDEDRIGICGGVERRDK